MQCMVCKLCSKEFPTWVLIDGKRRNLSKRKFCLDCSPFGQHNTKDLSEEYLGGTCSSKRICQMCNRSYLYNRADRKGHQSRICASCVVTKWRRNTKLKAVALKGGRCSECGYDRNAAALLFHHPGGKTFGISSNGVQNWNKIERELCKCILICLNCHAEAHHPHLNIDG